MQTAIYCCFYSSTDKCTYCMSLWIKVSVKGLKRRYFSIFLTIPTQAVEDVSQCTVVPQGAGSRFQSSPELPCMWLTGSSFLTRPRVVSIFFCLSLPVTMVLLRNPPTHPAKGCWPAGETGPNAQLLGRDARAFVDKGEGQCGEGKSEKEICTETYSVKRSHSWMSGRENVHTKHC